MRTGRRFVLLILPMLALGAYRLDSDKLLGFHHFRQAHDAMTARNFAFHEPNILRPTIDGVTYGKDLYLNDFPLYPYLLGMLWRAFGVHLLIGRLLSLAFGVLALWYYYKVLRRLIDDRWVVDLAVLFLGMTPVIAYFSRSLQRQSLFLFVLLAGVHHVLRYLDRPKSRDIVPGTAGLGVALLLNPFAVYVAIPLLWYGLKRNGRRLLYQWPLYLAATLAVLPAVAWYLHVLNASPHLETASMVALTAKMNQRDFLSLRRYAMWLVPDHWAALYQTTVRFVLPVVTSLAIFLYGLVKAPADRGYGFFKIWLLAVVAYFLVDFYPVAIVVHHYYYVNVAPLTALFLAHGVVVLVRASWRPWGLEVTRGVTEITVRLRHPGAGRVAVVALVLVALPLLVLGSFRYTRRMIVDAWHADYYEHRAVLTAAVGPDERLSVLAPSDDPLLSWVLEPALRHRLVRYTPERFDRLLAAGDFDALAVITDESSLPLRRILERISETDYIRGPVLRRKNLYLFRAVSESPDLIPEGEGEVRDELSRAPVDQRDRSSFQ